MIIDITDIIAYLSFVLVFETSMLFLFPITVSKISNNVKRDKNHLQKRRKLTA